MDGWLAGGLCAFQLLERRLLPAQDLVCAVSPEAYSSHNKRHHVLLNVHLKGKGRQSHLQECQLSFQDFQFCIHTHFMS